MTDFCVEQDRRGHQRQVKDSMMLSLLSLALEQAPHVPLTKDGAAQLIDVSTVFR